MLPEALFESPDQRSANLARGHRLGREDQAATAGVGVLASSPLSQAVSLANPLAITRLVTSSCMSVGSLVGPSTGVRSG